MKYRLTNELNPNYSPIEQILFNRGVVGEKAQQEFLSPTIASIKNPDGLGVDKLNKACELLKNVIEKNKNAIIIVDSDCDGFCSASLLFNYLYEVERDWAENHLDFMMHEEKAHGLSDLTNEILQEDVNLVLIPDAGSNDYEYHKILKENNIDCCCFDHHIVEEKELDTPAIIINNQICDYNKDLCGAAITWEFCRYYDVKVAKISTMPSYDYLDLVAVALVSDMMDIRNIEVKKLIELGLSNIKNPFIENLIQKNSYSIKDTSNLTPNDVAFYVAPFINAVVRSGTMEEKRNVFSAMLNKYTNTLVFSTKRGHSDGEQETLLDQMTRQISNIKSRQKRTIDAGFAKIKEKIEEENLLDNKVIVVTLESGEVDKNLAGLICNNLSPLYSKPVCILTKNERDGEIYYSGSARGCAKTGVVNFKDICQKTECIEYASGHEGAFGLSLKEKDIPEFIQKTNEILKDVNDESVYDVDLIYTYSVSPDNILKITELDNCWGTMFPQSKIAVESIPITNDKVQKFEKTSTTIKITLSNGVVLMKFRATPEEVKQLEQNSYRLTLVGKCNRNEYNGEVTAQIFIDDFVTQKTFLF